ncbi:hypothetical protein [Citrobacter koseri]
MNKILFAYPTLQKDGIKGLKWYQPMPMLSPSPTNELQTVIITIGFSVPVNHLVRTEIDILFNNHTVIVMHDDDGYFETSSINFIESDHVCYISSMFVSDVDLSKEGLYEAKITNFKNDEHGNKTSEIIDSHSCYFHVIHHTGDAVNGASL